MYLTEVGRQKSEVENTGVNLLTSVFGLRSSVFGLRSSVFGLPTESLQILLLRFEQFNGIVLHQCPDGVYANECADRDKNTSHSGYYHNKNSCPWPVR